MGMGMSPRLSFSGSFSGLADLESQDAGGGGRGSTAGGGGRGSTAARHNSLAGVPLSGEGGGLGSLSEVGNYFSRDRSERRTRGESGLAAMSTTPA